MTDGVTDGPDSREALASKNTLKSYLVLEYVTSTVLGGKVQFLFLRSNKTFCVVKQMGNIGGFWNPHFKK